MNASPFAFVDGALDRADALRDDPEALATLWPDARVVLLDDDGKALADADRMLAAPTGRTLGGVPAAAVFLGKRGDTAWFAGRAATTDFEAPMRVELRAAAISWPAFDATVFAQARAVLHWHARHRHCGACGGELAFVRAGLARDWRDAAADGDGIVLSAPISIARWLAQCWLAEVTGAPVGRG